MKTYKLIKTYPGSPKLGSVHKLHSTTLNDEKPAIYYNHNWITPEEHPEFWEVIEKEYEILSFSTPDGDILEIHSDKKYAFKKGFDYDDTGSLYVEECLADSFYKIHSVKRLSDGEIFSVGDELEKSCISYCMLENTRITKIGVIKNPQAEVVLSLSTEALGKLMFSASNEENNYNVELKKAIKKAEKKYSKNDIIKFLRSSAIFTSLTKENDDKLIELFTNTIK